MENQITEQACIHCGCTIGDLDVPAVDDDEAWERLAREHVTNCEWVLSRAWRTDDLESSKQYDPDRFIVH